MEVKSLTGEGQSEMESAGTSNHISGFETQALKNRDRQGNHFPDLQSRGMACQNNSIDNKYIVPQVN